MPGCAAPATPTDPIDHLDGPTKVYVMQVREAERIYRETVRQAAKDRQLRINEALEACELAMRRHPGDSPRPADAPPAGQPAGRGSRGEVGETAQE